MGQIGLSKFHREAIGIARTDELELRIAKIPDKNPLNSVKLEINILYVHESYPKD